MRNGVEICHRPVAGHVTSSPRPLTPLPPGSEKMAKVSELYDVTWEGNCGRRGSWKTESRGKRFGNICCPKRLGFSGLFGTGLAELRWCLRWSGGWPLPWPGHRLEVAVFPPLVVTVDWLTVPLPRRSRGPGKLPLLGGRDLGLGLSHNSCGCWGARSRRGSCLLKRLCSRQNKGPVEAF